MPGAGTIIIPILQKKFRHNEVSSFLSSHIWKVVALRLGPRQSDSGAVSLHCFLSESPLRESQFLHVV